MTKLGIMPMTTLLGGNAESAQAVLNCVDKKIALAVLTDNELRLGFDDGSALRIFDDGQSCCEERFMRTDDNLADFICSDFRGAEIRDGGVYSDENEDNYSTEEIQFLIIFTSVGSFTMSNHNVHNGYYSGFSVKAVEE